MPTFSAPFSGDSRYILEAIVTETSQSIENNTTTISVTVRVRFTGDLSAGAWTGYAQSWSREIWLGVVSGTWTYDFRQYSAKNIDVGGHTIQHMADGTLTIVVKANANMDGKGSASINTTMVLTPIPRGMVYVGNASGSPIRGQAYIGNASGVPVMVKEVWIGDANGVPRRST